MKQCFRRNLAWNWEILIIMLLFIFSCDEGFLFLISRICSGGCVSLLINGFFVYQTVCAAFEHQLQKFRVSSPPNSTCIENGSSTNVAMMAGSDGIGTNHSKEHTNASTHPPLSPTAVNPNVRSCGSLTSISSHTSATSGSSNEEQKKKDQNRRNWVGVCRN